MPSHTSSEHGPRSRLLARALRACALAGLLLAGIGLPPVVGAGVLVRRAAVSVDTTTGSLAGGAVREATVVTAADGTPVARLYDRYRLPVGAAGIADTMKAAIAAIEDRRFFDHDGVDYPGLARALAANAATGGSGAYGVEAAARTYFDTSADALTLTQAAMLAGIVRAPSLYDPVTHPEAARGRRAEVLHAMSAVGSITTAQEATAQVAPLGVVTPLSRPAPGCATAVTGNGFFCDYVEHYLAAAGIGPDELRTGGYTIRTTLDPRVQGQLARAVDQVPDDRGVANVAAVVAPQPGRRPVLGLAANRAFGPDRSGGESSLPLITAPLRGAGSVYKIFTAAAVIERGLVNPDTEIAVPDTYTARSFRDGSSAYTVAHLGSYDDRLTLTRALATSPNTAFVALEDRLGTVVPVVDAARALGLRNTLDAPAAGGGTVGRAVVAQEQGSFTLGPNPTSPLELANVAATIVADGRWCPPTPIASITDRNGRPVTLPASPCERAVPSSVDAQLRAGLSQDWSTGTSADAADAAGWDRPIIGKTGTTQQSASAAFLGATEAYAGAVMTFSDRGALQPVCQDSPRTCSTGDLTGGSIPAETWYDAIVPLHRGVP